MTDGDARLVSREADRREIGQRALRVLLVPDLGLDGKERHRLVPGHAAHQLIGKPGRLLASSRLAVALGLVVETRDQQPANVGRVVASEAWTAAVLVHDFSTVLRRFVQRVSDVEPKDTRENVHDLLRLGPAGKPQADQLERAEDQHQVPGVLAGLLVTLDGLAGPWNPLDRAVRLRA